MAYGKMHPVVTPYNSTLQQGTTRSTSPNHAHISQCSSEVHGVVLFSTLTVVYLM